MAVHMTIPEFLVGLAVGSALIGFWIALRFPDRGPTTIHFAVFHVMASFAVGWAAADALSTIVGFGTTAAYAAIFCLVLPALAYTFLAGAWFLKLAHGMISAHRH
ncbi:MAG TPA: hypothetical protein VEO37_05515 [Thermoanaerobaculia bacterium]|nr:hypothetical protein [Thermoanaerobaculia bacterium]